MDTNGNLFVVLPDGTNVDVTPRLVGDYAYIQDYLFGICGDKFEPLIKFGGDYLRDKRPTVWVGEQIDLTCDLVSISGAANPPPITNYEWSVGGNAIANYVVTNLQYTNSVITNWVITDGGTNLMAQGTLLTNIAPNGL